MCGEYRKTYNKSACIYRTATSVELIACCCSRHRRTANGLDAHSLKPTQPPKPTPPLNLPSEPGSKPITGEEYPKRTNLV